MRVSILFFLAAAALFLSAVALAQAPSFQPVGTVSQLMIDLIYPSSDAIFYIERAPPKNEVEWNAIRAQALLLAESGNLLMMAGRVRDQGNWMKDSKMLIDAGAAAYKAASAKDMTAILALNDQLNAACVTCHEQYRPNYHKKP
jgi:cytochrome c553